MSTMRPINMTPAASAIKRSCRVQPDTALAVRVGGAHHRQPQHRLDGEEDDQKVHQITGGPGQQVDRLRDEIEHECARRAQPDYTTAPTQGQFSNGHVTMM